MAYTLQAIIGHADDMTNPPCESLATVALSAGMALWPIDSKCQEKYGIPFLPFTDEGVDDMPPMISSFAAALPRCAYIEAEFFGGVGIQASVLFDHGRPTGAVRKSGDAINEALRALGVTPRDGYDEFDTVGLGAERHTDSWSARSADDATRPA